MRQARANSGPARELHCFTASCSHFFGVHGCLPARRSARSHALTRGTPIPTSPLTLFPAHAFADPHRLTQSYNLIRRIPRFPFKRAPRRSKTQPPRQRAGAPIQIRVAPANNVSATPTPLASHRPCRFNRIPICNAASPQQPALVESHLLRIEHVAKFCFSATAFHESFADRFRRAGRLRRRRGR